MTHHYYPPTLSFPNSPTKVKVLIAQPLNFPFSHGWLCTLPMATKSLSHQKLSPHSLLCDLREVTQPLVHGFCPCELCKAKDPTATQLKCLETGQAPSGSAQEEPRSPCHGAAPQRQHHRGASCTRT